MVKAPDRPTKPGAPCSICTGGQRKAIDAAITAGVPQRDIAGQFGASKSSVARHAKDCFPRGAVLAASVVGLGDLVSGANITSEVIDLQRRTLVILTKAEDTEELSVALGAIREARGNLELEARLTGQLRQDPATQVNVLLASPGWSGYLERLLGAMCPRCRERAEVELAAGVDAE